MSTIVTSEFAAQFPVDQVEEIVHHEPHRKKEKGLEPVKMAVNFTSMIDVIFQLLIYFIITATFVMGEGVLTVKVPQGPGDPKPQNTPPAQPLNILVGSAGVDGIGYRVTIEGVAEPANFNELSQSLIQLQYDPDRGYNGPYKPDNPVIIKPAAEVRWQHVVNAFNAALRARYTNIKFAQPEHGG